MEQRPHHPGGGEQHPPVNSYGTDNPVRQAQIERARTDASRERKHDRLQLERLVELGLDPEDAEVLIEFDHATRKAGADGEHFRTTSMEETRRDLADLLSLRHRAGGAAALIAFAADLRKDIGSGRLMNVVPPSIADYQAAGLDRRDALTVADFEYYLRYKLASADDPAAGLGIERGERAPQTAPRVHVVDHRTADGGEPRGQWIDADQSAEDLNETISAALGQQSTTSPAGWSVTAAEGFAGIDVFGCSDSQLIAALGQGVAEHGAAFVAWVELHGTGDPEMVARFTDFYIGSYQSERDWAESVAVDLEWLDQLDRVVDPTLRPYVRIDYDKVARDTRSSWDLITGADDRVHVFLR